MVAESQRIAEMGLPEEAQEKFIIRASKRPFYNISPMDISKMGQSDIKDNLNTYVQSFFKDAREIFEHFKFEEFVGQLADANLLYKVVQKFANTDLSPEAISNHEMGFVFEELIRRFAESSNETAGEHFIPLDIVHLTTSLVFMEDDEALTKDGIIRTIYDSTAGTGGFLSSGMEYVLELNPDAVMRIYIKTTSGWVYTAFIIDVFARAIAGWKVSNRMNTDMVMAALNQAITDRNNPKDVIHHSDRGVQYLSIRYTYKTKDSGVIASVGTTGD